MSNIRKIKNPVIRIIFAGYFVIEKFDTAPPKLLLVLVCAIYSDILHIFILVPCLFYISLKIL